MITRELPQYADIVRRLTPVLAGLPPKLIAIDGPMSSGKTTLGRHLAWHFIELSKLIILVWAVPSP
jgi:deoxyadenosine/deoxycytidine kinase